jgi:predicted nucleotidyltransferase
MIIKKREKHSLARLEELKRAIADKADFPRLDDLCVYVTGSYGRGEASEFSDLDLFFVHRGTRAKDRVTNSDKALLDADLIRIADRLGFPPFTKGGRYLEIHYLDDVVDSVGGQDEDFHNSFTARMLLLTEGKPILNEKLYAEALSRLVGVYFRDYHDHEKNFLPIFLVNDIIRYWKTMCLNYEHIRNRMPKDALTEAELRARKNEAHVKNLKLKFSRMLTCFSFVVAVIAAGKSVTSDEVARVAATSPLKRLGEVAARHPKIKTMVDEAREEYDWFLEVTGRDSDSVKAWIGDRDTRHKAFERGRRFGGRIYRILKGVAGGDVMRYVVV